VGTNKAAQLQHNSNFPGIEKHRCLLLKPFLRFLMDKAVPIFARGSAAGLGSGRLPVAPDYELLRQIGKGGFGFGWRGTRQPG
jgi:hypothetical protein